MKMWAGKYFKVSLFVLIAAGFTAYATAQSISTSGLKDEDVFFEKLFKNYQGRFDSILAHRMDWNVQIIYTQINRGNNGIPAFKNFTFNQMHAPYFYPAGTVALPVALLALQKIRALAKPELTPNSSMITGASFKGESAVYDDPNTPDGRPTVAQYIKEMLLVGDNNAYNRLYEFLGQQYINEELRTKGFKDAEIIHRLGEIQGDEENRHTNPVSFYNNKKQLIYKQEMQYNRSVFGERNDLAGKGYLVDTVLINEPMDFSKKNRLSLSDLHAMLTGLVFPEKEEKHFDISTDDRKFILKYLSSYPRESLYPSYDSSNPDAAGKFILAGGQKNDLPKNIRIFNTTGKDFGQLTDIAYIMDTVNKVEFLVSATIYCNSDGILNDDKYDYETIGIPFMKTLGKALYDYELKRKKTNLPDLSPMIFRYDNLF